MTTDPEDVATIAVLDTKVDMLLTEVTALREAVMTGAIPQRTTSLESRVKRLEGNLRWTVLLVIAAVAETVLRQAGITG